MNQATFKLIKATTKYITNPRVEEWIGGMDKSVRLAWGILRFLASGSRTFDDISKKFGIHKNTTIQIIKALEEGGAKIKRQRGENNSHILSYKFAKSKPREGVIATIPAAWKGEFVEIPQGKSKYHKWEDKDTPCLHLHSILRDPWGKEVFVYPRIQFMKTDAAEKPYRLDLIAIPRSKSDRGDTPSFRGRVIRETWPGIFGHTTEPCQFFASLPTNTPKLWMNLSICEF